MSVGLVELAYKLFEGKLYGKSSHFLFNKFVR